jgi:predicted Zn-dependent protease
MASDEGGLWGLMDREEKQLRRSPFILSEPRLRDYLQEIACRLAQGHCPDTRVHVIRTPLFNASMAPNGMVQIWTGLLLRMDNEAQLAAVVGHEIGHYLARHSVERLRDAKSRTAFMQFMSALGVVGAIAQLVAAAGGLAYSREQETEADQISVSLMSNAGYDPREAAKVWANLLLEMKARPGRNPERESALFATHPSPVERQENLLRMAQAVPGGVTNEEAWKERTRPFRREWLLEEIKRGQHEESIALFTRMLERSPLQTDVLCARGEVRRMRARDDDLAQALSDFAAASDAGDAPAEVHRGMGLIFRLQKRTGEAKASFERYLAMAPEAPDSMMIKQYMEELGS